MNTEQLAQPGHQRSRQDGGILIFALFVMIFTVGIVASGSMIMKANKAKTDVTFMLDGQAVSFARAGLMEAMNWFRRQTSQPVLTFAPQLDTTVDPKILDTDDPDVGLVREFRISGNIYGRYEVWKEWSADPDPIRLARRQRLQARDISQRRGRTSPGTTWLIRCVGFVYVQRDNTRSFRQQPNYVVATEILQAEISRMAFALPGQAALCVRNGADIDLGPNVRVDGGATAVGMYYLSGTGSPTVDGTADVTGVAPVAPAVTYDDSVKFVFDSTDADLNGMADLHLSNATDFPAKVPPGGLVVLDTPTTIQFTKARPLSGSGIVVVRGDVEILAGSTSSFFGLLYIDGNLTVTSPALIQGAVIVTKKFAASGAGDYTDLNYDDAIIQKLQNTMSTYRVSRGPRRRVQR